MKDEYMMWIIILLLTSIVLFIYVSTPKRYCHTEETTEKWIGDGRWKDLTGDYQVICEEGIDVKTYTYGGTNKATLFSCLSLIDGRCSGTGKICMIKTKTKVCEVK